MFEDILLTDQPVHVNSSTLENLPRRPTSLLYSTLFEDVLVTDQLIYFICVYGPVYSTVFKDVLRSWNLHLH